MCIFITVWPYEAGKEKSRELDIEKPLPRA